MAATEGIDKSLFDYIGHIEVNSYDGITLSYKNIMTMVGQYRYVTDDDGNVIDPDPMTELEEKIAKINTFNFTLTKVITTQENQTALPVDHVVTDDNSMYVIVNNIMLENVVVVGDDNLQKNINSLNHVGKSFAVYNTSSITISLFNSLWEFFQEYPINPPAGWSHEDFDPEEDHSIPSGTVFNIPLIVEDINKKSIKLLLEVTYIKKNEEEEEEDTGSENEGNNNWNIIDDESEELVFTEPYVSREGYEKYVYVNTYSLEDIGNLPNRTLYAKDNFARLSVDDRCVENFIIRLAVNGVPRTWNFSPASINIKGKNYKRITKMNNPEVSYALLRTNPKLTGNVKVVVDSDSNIYLDTFKISTALSQKQYRKVKVSSTDYYGENLMTRYKSIPSTDFYKVEDQCYTLFTPAQTYKGEYYDLYRMGVKTNDDDLYKENYSIFAPICLKEYSPDFFVVFKVDKSRAEYDEDKMTDKEKIKYFIKHGIVVKSYDMRPGSNLGDYVNNIISNSASFVGDIYESYESNNYNRFIGISLDKGVVTSIYESPYSESYINNQVSLNDYYTKGFERNHIVSKNIINFEFMFDDPKAELFSISTYFGLYIKLNSDNTFSCIGTDNGINLFDTKLNTFESTSSISSISTNPFIYGLATPYEFIRLNKSIDLSSEVSNFALKPYKNILSTAVYKDAVANVKSFLTFTLNSSLLHGDHLRIIDNDTLHIYEITIANAEDINTKNDISPVIMNSSNSGDASYKIYRVSIYFNPEDGLRNDDSDIQKELTNDLADKIFRAFDKISEYTNRCSYKVYNIGNNSIGIEGYSENMIFERICAPSGLDTTLNEYIYSTNDEKEIISFYGKVYPEKLILNLNDEFGMSSVYRYLYPLNFEIVGSRMAYAMSFISTSDISDEYFYNGEILDTNIFDTKTILYKSNNAYERYNTFKIKYFFTDLKDNYKIKDDTCELKYVPHFKNANKFIFNVSNPDLNIKDLLLYSAYPLNEGLCSIFDVKDFDFDVLDAESRISLSSRSSSQYIGTPGEYAENSIFSSLSEESDMNESSMGESSDEKDEEELVINISFAELSNINNFNKHFGWFTKNKNSGGEREDLYKAYFNANLNNDSYIKIILRPFINAETIPIEDVNHEDYDSIVKVYIAYSLVDKAAADDFILDSSSNYYVEDADDTAICPYNIDPEKFFVLSTEKFSSKSKFTTDLSLLPAAVRLREDSEESIFDYIDKYQQLKFIDSSVNDKREILEKQLLKYYVNTHNKLDVSLVSPHTCKWKSIGTDARGENLRLMYDYDSIVTEKEGLVNKSYYVCGTESYNTYLGYLCYGGKNNETTIYKKYFTKSLTSPTTSEESNASHKMLGIYLKDSILDDKGSLDDILYDSKDYDNKFSVAYKSGDNTIEFISAGVKFRIKSNNDNAINMNNYHGYSAVFVSLPDINRNYTKDFDLIIDETKKEIMLVWYQPVNTFKYGNSYSASATYLLENSKTYTCKLRNSFDFNNVFCGYYASAVHDGESYNIAKLPDINSFGKTGKDPLTGRVGRRLCKKKGHIYFSSMGSEDSYTKLNKLMFVGKLFHSSPIPYGTSYDTIKSTYPYYFSEDSISLESPFFWYNNDHDRATNSNLSNYSYDYSKCINAFLVTDDPSCIISEVSTFADLQNQINNCAIYIKTADGKKDYTTLKNVLTLSVVEPITYTVNSLIEKNTVKKGYVHSTYAEPVMKSMLSFLYNDNSGIEETFKYSFDGGNIFVSGVNKINQEWINKYTEESNFCVSDAISEVKDASSNNKVTTTETSFLIPSIDVIHNKSIMDSSWSKNIYRKYYRLGNTVSNIEEDYDSVHGYTTGYEQKNFFNSRGIQLRKYINGKKEKDDIEITFWRNTSISYNKGYIRLNITDSLMYLILNSKAFMNEWKYLKISSNDSKINYIKNTILPLININNKSRFILKENKISNNKFTFEREYDDSFCEVKNYKNTLKYENGKYYMYVYPENDYAYCVKMIIDL